MRGAGKADDMSIYTYARVLRSRESDESVPQFFYWSKNFADL